MLDVMGGQRGLSGLRTIAPGLAAPVLALSVLALSGLAAGCDGTPASQAGSPPGGTTAPVSTPAAAPVPTRSGPPSGPPSSPAGTAALPSYTPPPARHLERPAGIGRVPGSACDPATTAGHFFAASWAANAVSYVRRGAPVPAVQWADAARVLPVYRDGVARSRSALRAAGVPAGFVVFRDLADADAGMREGIAAARSKADSRVLPVYIKVVTAVDHLVESCGVLE
jgi:hypothetical protein